MFVLWWFYLLHVLLLISNILARNSFGIQGWWHERLGYEA